MESSHDEAYQRVGADESAGLALHARPVRRSIQSLDEQPMSRTRKERDEVYAILRWDGFHGTGADPEVLVTVKQGVRSQELAKAEGAHLNALSEGKGV